MTGRLVRLGWRPLLAALVLASCDIPTSTPIWTTDWAIPAGRMTIGVDALLPKGVALAPDSSAFVVILPGNRTTGKLRDSCAECVASAAVGAPKPAFEMRLSSRVRLPAGLVTAKVSGSSVPIEVVNNLNFDPIRPGAETGLIRVGATSQGVVLGEKSRSGEDVGFRPGESLQLDVPLAGVVHEEGEINFVLDSPAGDPIEFDPSLEVELIVGDTELYITEAQVRVRDLTISSLPTTTRVSGIPEGVVDRLEGGGLEVDIDNPFEVQGLVQLRISYDGGILVRDTDLVAGQTTRSFDFSTLEIRDLLASSEIEVALVGEVQAISGIVTVRPGQKLVLTPRLTATLRMES